MHSPRQSSHQQTDKKRWDILCLHTLCFWERNSKPFAKHYCIWDSLTFFLQSFSLALPLSLPLPLPLLVSPSPSLSLSLCVLRLCLVVCACLYVTMSVYLCSSLSVSVTVHRVIMSVYLYLCLWFSEDRAVCYPVGQIWEWIGQLRSMDSNVPFKGNKPGKLLRKCLKFARCKYENSFFQQTQKQVCVFTDLPQVEALQTCKKFFPLITFCTISFTLCSCYAGDSLSVHLSSLMLACLRCFHCRQSCAVSSGHQDISYIGPNLENHCKLYKYSPQNAPLTSLFM